MNENSIIQFSIKKSHITIFKERKRRKLYDVKQELKKKAKSEVSKSRKFNMKNEILEKKELWRVEKAIFSLSHINVLTDTSGMLVYVRKKTFGIFYIRFFVIHATLLQQGMPLIWNVLNKKKKNRKRGRQHTSPGLRWHNFCKTYNNKILEHVLHNIPTTYLTKLRHHVKNNFLFFYSKKKKSIKNSPKRTKNEKLSSNKILDSKFIFYENQKWKLCKNQGREYSHNKQKKCDIQIRNERFEKKFFLPLCLLDEIVFFYYISFFSYMATIRANIFLGLPK